MIYRPEVDGLRAVAVVPVMLFHAGLGYAQGGYVGVDVFFVISGYLITSILLNELRDDDFSIVRFYERRARRILPALFFVMLCCMPFAWLWLTPLELKDFGQSLAAVAVFASNIHFWIETDYFDTAAEFKPLLHTWSLAVEEQFYILFPPFLATLWYYANRWKSVVVALLLVCSLYLAHELSERVEFSFFMLPTRAWELLLGTLIALHLSKHGFIQRGGVNQVGSIIGVVLIAGAVLFFDETTPIPGPHALVPTVGAALVIICAVESTVVHRLLSSRPMVGVGLVSYSAYLWHQPVLAFARVRTLGELVVWQALLLCVLALGLAFFSWKFVEAPFRDKRRITFPVIISLSCLGIFVFASIGALLHVNEGFKARPTFYDGYHNLQFGNYEFDNRKLRSESWSLLRTEAGQNSYGLDGNAFDQQLWFQKNDHRRKMLIVGNSHSKDLYNVFVNSEKVTSEYQIARYGAQIRTLSDAFFTSKNFMASDVVVIASRFTERDLANLEQLVKRLVAEDKHVVLVPRSFDFYFNGMLTEADRTLLLNDRTRTVAELAVLANQKYSDEYQGGRLSDRLFVKSQRAVIEISHKHGVAIFDKMDYICPNDVCVGVDPTYSKYFYDYGHHTLEGAKAFGEIVDRLSLHLKLKRTF